MSSLLCAATVPQYQRQQKSLSKEPGDTYGFESSQDKQMDAATAPKPNPCDCQQCCCNSTAALRMRRNWQGFWRPPHKNNKDYALIRSEGVGAAFCGVERTKTELSGMPMMGPPLHELGSGVALSSSTDSGLAETSRYLLRRIRKLELTNQIIREAYVEVQAMLQAERQSKITQINTLERKHEEDMEQLVLEYEQRLHMADTDDDLDMDDCGVLEPHSSSPREYSFQPSFSTTATRNSSLPPTGGGGAISETTSPVMQAALPAPLSMRRTVSETAFKPSVDSASLFEMDIEFLDTTATPLESLNGDNDEDDEDAQSDISWETDDSESESESELDDSDAEEGEEHIIEAVRFTTICTYEETDTDTDADTDFESETEADVDNNNKRREMVEGDEESSSSSSVVATVGDDEDVDPADAVLGRYYSQDNGKLNFEADIDDIPSEGYKESGSSWFGNRDTTTQFEERREADGATMMSDKTECSWDRETKVIALLPGEQRVAKFVYRASLHLQQGARNGLSLGYMLHNLEALSDKFMISNHKALLCAFIESLYQLSEGDNQKEEEEDSKSKPSSARPSALSKRQRHEISSLDDAFGRIVKLLHTFIVGPDDQDSVLQQLDQLSVANHSKRASKHVVLLRAMYDHELIDRSLILHWHSALLKGGGGCEDDKKQELYDNAASLISDIVNDKESGNDMAATLDEVQQQIQLCTSTGTCSSSSITPSTPCQVGFGAAVASRCCCTGVTTPASDENTTLHSQSSDTEDGSSSSNILDIAGGIYKRQQQHLSTKQVTFV